MTHEYEVYQIFTADVVTDESGAKVLTSVKWGTNAKNRHCCGQDW